MKSTIDNDPTIIRSTVSKAYAAAITKTADSCCAPTCCSSPGPKLAEQIGYSDDQLSSVPQEAAASSFGCGNPLAFAGVEAGQTVLDLGSGAGLDLLLAATAVGPDGRVIGVDMTDEMIATARENIRREGLDNVEVRKGIIEDLPVEDSSVDWVISNCVINLSPEKERVFAEIHRVLKPGGTMQVSDIVVEDLPGWVREHRELFTACVGGAVSEEEYLGGLTDAGLDDPEIIDRVTYTAANIRGFLDSDDMPLTDAQRQALQSRAGGIAAALAGKVASVKVRARKAR